MPVDGYVRDRQDFDLDPAPVRIEMERVERARLPPVQNRGFGMYRSASDLDLSRIASLRQGRLGTVPGYRLGGGRRHYLSIRDDSV